MNLQGKQISELLNLTHKGVGEFNTLSSLNLRRNIYVHINETFAMCNTTLKVLLNIQGFNLLQVIDNMNSLNLNGFRKTSEVILLA